MSIYLHGRTYVVYLYCGLMNKKEQDKLAVKVVYLYCGLMNKKEQDKLAVKVIYCTHL